MSERDAGQSAAGDTAIVRAAIYPAIGIARLGNSESEYFLSPEVTDPLPEPPGFYRDPTGALKRQSARFRVYGLNAAGRAVTELTADNAEIRWTVHLANKKSAWYQFQIALDIPEAGSAPPSWLRNITITDRSRLVIDAGPGISLAGMPEAAQLTALIPARFLARGSISGRFEPIRRAD